MRAVELWSRHWPAAAAFVFALAAAAPLARPATTGAARARHVEWPAAFDGRALRPLALSPVEQRFAATFPGAIGRFSDGERVLVLRAIDAPTRMLHPAADCFRALGWRLSQARLERDARQRLWRCFEARREGDDALRVCERIEGSDGSSFTDASAWFWAASFASSAGPWQAVTVVEAL